MSPGNPAAGITESGGCWAGAGGFEPSSDPEVPRGLKWSGMKGIKDPRRIPAAPSLVPLVLIAKPAVSRADVQQENLAPVLIALSTPRGLAVTRRNQAPRNR